MIMLRHKTYIFLLALLLFVPVSGICGGRSDLVIQRGQIMDSLRASLASVCTPADSLGILYNIYDLSPIHKNHDVAEEAYHVARRAGDTRAMFDLLRRLLSNTRNTDSLTRIYEARLDAMPDCEEKRETKSYFKLLKIFYDVRYASDSVTRARSSEKIQHMLQQYNTRGKKNLSVYDKFENVFTSAIYLESTAPGELLTGKLIELERLLDQLPGKHSYLSSLFYTFVSTAYLTAGDLPSTARISSMYNAFCDTLERDYHARGRVYRNFDTYRYINDRRVMACYDVLTLRQVDSIYARICDLADGNEEIRSDMNNNLRADIYWNMAHGRYAEAMSLLKKAYDRQSNQTMRNLVLREYIKAARATGDTTALIFALDQMNQVIQDRLDDRIFNSTIQLQILYNNSSLYEANSELREKNRQLSDEQARRAQLYIIIGLLVLIPVIVVLYLAWRRARIRSNELVANQTRLKEERDAARQAQQSVIIAREKANLADRQKTDFIHDIVHEITEPTNAIVGYTQLIADSVSGERRAILGRFIDEIHANAGELKKLVDNVFNNSAVKDQPGTSDSDDHHPES